MTYLQYQKKRLLMLFYFKLQYKRLYRNAKDNNSNFYFAAPVTLLLLIAIGSIVIQNIQFGSEIIAAISLFLLVSLNSGKHKEFLYFHFQRKEVIFIKQIENIIVCLPFSLLLLFHFEWLLAALSLFSGVVLALLPPLRSKSNVTPTPFNKRPFEYTINFRKYWLILIGLYAISVIGFSVHNYNLICVVLLLISASQLSYFKDAEPAEWIWIYNKNPKNFLLKKIALVSLQSALLSFPVALGIVILAPSYWLIVLGILTFGILIVILALLIKYSYYPTVDSLIGSIYLTISILAPPVMLLSIPHFFKNAKQNQKDLLDD
jgi:hypothetical protein